MDNRISLFRVKIKMLNRHKQTPQLNNIFSACEAPNFILHEEYTVTLDFDVGETFEISDASSKIDEMQIDKLYQYS